MSVLPVLALLSWGYTDGDAYCRLEHLTELAGVGTKLLRRGIETLQALMIIEASVCARSGVLTFRQPSAVLGSRRGFFVMRRTLVDSGLWSQMTRSERAVAVAIAASVPAERWIDSDGDSEMDGEVDEWARECGAMEAADEERLANGPHGVPVPDHECASRVGLLSLATLADLTALDRATVYRAIQGLRSGYGAPVVHSISTENGHWFHTPAAYWGVSDPAPAAIEGSRQSTRHEAANAAA
jgi:hypothetical protein